MTTAATTGRVAWADATKGLTIVLIVVYHSGLILGQAHVIGSGWTDFNMLFPLLRVPLFFAVSGLFAASVIARPWRTLWATRLSPLVWAFGAWALLRFAFFSVFPLSSRPYENDFASVIQAVWAPLTAAWYLHALFLFMVMAKLTVRVPPWLQVAVAALLSALVLNGLVSFPETYYERLAVHYVFFVGACYLKNPLRRAVDASNTTSTLLLLGGYVVGSVVAVQHGVDWLKLPLAVLAVPAGFFLARQVTGSGLGRLLTWIGERTLPIYVCHVLVIGFAAWVMVRRDIGLTGTAAEVWWPLALTVVALLVSVAVWSVAMRSPLRLMYEPPAFFRLSPTPAPRHRAVRHKTARPASSLAMGTLKGEQLT